MSTATRRLAHATIAEFNVIAGQVTTLGKPVSLTSGEVKDTASGADDAIGIARASVTAGATNRRVQVTLWAPVEVVLVGTGGATESTKAVVVADGMTDAPAHDSSGGTDDAIYGIFMETGAATERVGMMVMASNRGSA